ncbi:MAG: (d)CMP kinase [SAR324 cluster bacterium]|nr:(d)CMP kinase [SAR324 cluster bacterium]
MMSFKIIAIDGPTGSGKSTIARLLAKEKGFLYVDTGAMFRCLGYAWKKQGLCQNDEVLRKLGLDTKIVFEPDGRVYCNGEEVTELIRGEDISLLASQISKFPLIRQNMKAQQRQLVREAEKIGNYHGAVLEGRDIGTIVFPDASLKFFLDGNNKIRAQRRFEQLAAKGESVSYEEILNALETRDAQDRNREIAPLLPAKDAIHVNSTNLTIPEVLSFLISEIEQVR